MELGDEIRDALRVDLLCRFIAETREKPAERDTVGLHGSRRNIDTCRHPTRSEIPQRHRLGRGEAKIRDTAGCELAAEPALALVRLALCREAAGVEPRALPAAEPVDDAEANRA